MVDKIKYAKFEKHENPIQLSFGEFLNTKPFTFEEVGFVQMEQWSKIQHIQRESKSEPQGQDEKILHYEL